MDGRADSGHNLGVKVHYRDDAVSEAYGQPAGVMRVLTGVEVKSGGFGMGPDNRSSRGRQLSMPVAPSIVLAD